MSSDPGGRLQWRSGNTGGFGTIQSTAGVLTVFVEWILACGRTNRQGSIRGLRARSCAAETHVPLLKQDSETDFAGADGRLAPAGRAYIVTSNIVSTIHFAIVPKIAKKMDKALEMATDKAHSRYMSWLNNSTT